MRVIPNACIPVRDGVKLAADVYLPIEGRVPALLHRTPYGKQSHLQIEWARYFVDAGFGVVVQDVRGRWESEGDWYPVRNEGPDGADTIAWIAEQEWSDGSVGMYGGSYAGWVQWAAAREHPPALRTLVSTAAAGRWFEELPYSHGILNLQHLQWLNMVGGRTNQDNSLIDWDWVFDHRPLGTMDELVNRPMDAWQDWLRHRSLDDYWRAIRLEDDFSKLAIPALHITAWYDDDQPGAMYFYEGMTKSRAADGQHLLLGPWDHVGTRIPHRSFGPFDFGEQALVDIKALHLDWFERQMRDGEASPSRVRYFIIGPNVWRESTKWPPPESRSHDLYLGSGDEVGSLSDAPPAAAESSYVYDPSNPVRVPRNPGRDYQYSKVYETRDDDDIERSEIEGRPDVLVFESDRLTDEFVVVGRPILELYASSDCVDTDWFVWLADHWPDGRSFLISEGQLGARFRHSLAQPEPLRIGEIERFRIELSQTAYAFRPEHRVAVAITSSLFPRFARNLNTGGDPRIETRMVPARNTIHLGEVHPSRIALHVLDRQRS